jgi:hypothetical protein
MRVKLLDGASMSDWIYHNLHRYNSSFIFKLRRYSGQWVMAVDTYLSNEDKVKIAWPDGDQSIIRLECIADYEDNNRLGMSYCRHCCHFFETGTKCEYNCLNVYHIELTPGSSKNSNIASMVRSSILNCYNITQ